MLAFDFITLYTTILHNHLTKALSEVINFLFKSKNRSRMGFSRTLIYWKSKGCGRRYFARQTMTDAASFLITKYFGNPVFKQEIGTLMGIDLAPYWSNLLLYFFES